MTHTPYQWREDLFCEDDIVASLTDHAPWSAWLDAGNEPGDHSAERELDEIAEQFGIDRDDSAEDLAEQDFPVRLSEVPDPPSFCSGCLSWFS